MKNLTLAIIALSLVTSNAAVAGDKTGNAPGGTGIEQSTESMGATDKQGNTSTTGQTQSGGATLSNKEDCENAGQTWDATGKCQPGAVGGAGGAGGGGAGGAGGAGGGAGGAGGGG